MANSSASDGVLRLGTRRSLLAWAQSSWVAREIERLNPGVRVELVVVQRLELRQPLAAHGAPSEIGARARRSSAARGPSAAASVSLSVWRP